MAEFEYQNIEAWNTSIRLATSVGRLKIGSNLKAAADAHQQAFAQAGLARALIAEGSGRDGPAQIGNRLIVDMAREEGRRLKDGRIAFRRATHQEIANRIGTTRETVTRMLKEIERQGLIEIDGREIVLGSDFEKAF